MLRLESIVIILFYFEFLMLISVKFDAVLLIVIIIIYCYYDYYCCYYCFFMMLNSCFLNSGERTFGVLTKIDLMDQGTDAVDVS